ncbi:MAG: hypothetical protein HRT47_11095 [Candidatus Caenarcaniphilales bacterium]|nr:hypothetical protein [Candidatus Caenarcaniphilales bacterium]
MEPNDRSKHLWDFIHDESTEVKRTALRYVLNEPRLKEYEVQFWDLYNNETDKSFKEIYLSQLLNPGYPKADDLFLTALEGDNKYIVIHALKRQKDLVSRSLDDSRIMDKIMELIDSDDYDLAFSALNLLTAKDVLNSQRVKDKIEALTIDSKHEDLKEDAQELFEYTIAYAKKMNITNSTLDYIALNNQKNN